MISHALNAIHSPALKHIRFQKLNFYYGLPMIEFYCGRQSYRAGDTVEFHVSTESETFSLEIKRTGLEEETVKIQTGIPGNRHSLPDDVVENGCQWPVAFQMSVPDSWRSGFYKVIATASDGTVADGFFILRAIRNKSSILWVVSTNTWNAYNYFGGKSTYTDGGSSYSNAATCVSFHRPLPKGFITLPDDHGRLGDAGRPGEFTPYYDWCEKNGFEIWTGAASWSQWNRQFCTWAETNNIEIDYAASSDLEEHPDLLADYRLMLSVGHDEYWSWGMRDAVETFIANGGNVAFLSGNTAYWQVRLEDGYRRMVAYKSNVDSDPVVGTREERRNTGIWSHRLTQRPENSMTGLSFTRGGYARVGGVTPCSSGGYVVYRPEHWALEGTGLAYGDQLGSENYLIAYECDGCAFQFVNGRPVPTGEDGTPTNFEIIGIAPVQLFSHATAPPDLYGPDDLTDVQLVTRQILGKLDADSLSNFTYGHAIIGSYTHPGGGTVFNSGTTEWAYSLTDTVVSKITTNVIKRLSGRIKQ